MIFLSNRNNLCGGWEAEQPDTVLQPLSSEEAKGDGLNFHFARTRAPCNLIQEQLLRSLDVHVGRMDRRGRETTGAFENPTWTMPLSNHGGGGALGNRGDGATLKGFSLIDGLNPDRGPPATAIM